MLRCTGLDNLFLGLVCQIGVKAELVVRALVGAPLLADPPPPLTLRTNKPRRQSPSPSHPHKTPV